MEMWLRSWGLASVALVFAVPLTAQNSNRSVAVRIIVLPDATQAQQVLDRLRHGDDFAVLAKEKSIDPTADSGGYMGNIDPSSLRSELQQALAGLQPGQISKVAYIPEGYAILKVLPPHQVAEMEAAA